jgi:hypothetical protein
METSIQFAEEKHRRKSTSSQGIGGVVPLRHRSLSRKRTNSIDVRDKISALEDPEDEDAGLRDDRDYKKKQVRNMRDFEWCGLMQCAGVQREPDAPTGVPERRCHLWRYWYLASIRLLVYLYGSAKSRRSDGRVVVDHLVAYVDGHCQVHPSHFASRQ